MLNLPMIWDHLAPRLSGTSPAATRAATRAAARTTATEIVTVGRSSSQGSQAAGWAGSHVEGIETADAHQNHFEGLGL